jgi:hypothetical protein
LHDLILFDMAPTTQTDVGNNIGNAWQVRGRPYLVCLS